MNPKKAGAASSGKSNSPLNNPLILPSKGNNYFDKKQPVYPIIRQHFGVQSILQSYVSQKWKGGPEL
jgi:hypothetical protein